MNKVHCNACEAYADNTRHSTCPDHRFQHLEHYTGGESLSFLLNTHKILLDRIELDENYSSLLFLSGNVGAKNIETVINYNISQCTELTWLINYLQEYGHLETTTEIL